MTAYQKVYEFALNIYTVTKDFPKIEQFGLVSQMRRASISIPSNIAEGYRRKSRKEYIQFLNIAYGSSGELETQIALSNDLVILDDNNFKTLQGLIEEVSKLLFSLIQSLKN